MLATNGVAMDHSRAEYWATISVLLSWSRIRPQRLGRLHSCGGRLRQRGRNLPAGLAAVVLVVIHPPFDQVTYLRVCRRITARLWNGSGRRLTKETPTLKWRQVAPAVSALGVFGIGRLSGALWVVGRDRPLARAEDNAK
jgi:hypothetical protein